MTKSQIKFVVESYAKYFGRAADADTIEAYGLKENGKAEKTSVILKNIIADADAEKAELSTSDFVNNAFQNLFGRDATTKEMNKYSKVVEKGKNLPINSIVKSAAKADQAVNKNKLEVAAKYADLGGKGDLDLSKISKGNLVDLKTVTTLADLQAKYDALADNSGIPSSFDGKTFVLTTSVDTGKDFVGTAKNDLFVASDAGAAGNIPTWSVADTIDGGKGIDGLTIVTDVANAVDTDKFANNTMKSIEIVDINAGTQSITLDTTQAGKVAENFKAVTDLKLTTTSTINVTGGKNIVAKATGLITIGEDAITTTAATIEKITIDSAAAGATIGAVANTSVDALKELTVKNGVAAKTVAVTTAVETLKVNLDNSAATSVVDLLDAKLKTLNVDASGKDSSVDFDTSSTILETLNISGNAKLTLAAASTVATTSNVKEINVTNTKGVVITTALNDTTKFTGGTGADSVEIGATTKAIAMGAGDDTVKLTSTKTILGTGGSVDAGAGKDTISMTAADAVTISGKVDGKFNSTFSNFEVLEVIGATAAAVINTQKINNVSQVNIAGLALTVGTQINDLVNNGTVKITNNVANVFAVNLKDIGLGLTTDVLNLEVSNTANITTASTVTAAGVETININSDDANTKATGTLSHDLILTAADATSIVVTGDAGLDLTTGAGSSAVKLTSFDASASTVGVKFASNSTTNVTIKGGAGDDDLTGSTLNDTIIGGAGDDILSGGAGVDTLTGGAGKDTFVIIAQNTTTVGIDKITDFVAGTDIIKTAAGTAANSLTDLRASDLSASANVGAAANAAMIAANAATADDVVLFTYQSKVYAVVEKDAAAGFTDGTDFIVEITGVTGTVTTADFLV